MAQLPQIDSLAAPDKAVARSTRKRRFPALNLPFLVVVGILVCYGLVVVWSAVANDPDYSFSRQAAGVAAGIVAMVLIWRFDYRRLAGMTRVFLVVNVVLILSPHLPVIGVTTMGATSWINVGMQIQPGEFAKITVILLDASVMARYGGRLDAPREYCKALGIMLVPFLCIMTQPDLGTGLVYLFIAATALVVGGARLKYLLVTLGLFVAAIVAVFAIDEVLKYQTADGTWEYRLLKQYQRNRLLVFLDQGGADLSDEGYNLQQAKIAIGSGGLFGKGLLQSSQGTLGYLPEAPTDFIFCVLAEELGFVGAMALLALYAALVVVCIRIARGSGDMFGMMIVMCVVGMWLFQILENIGMDVGLMPITGIPLPFVSYGSSFMVVNFALLGFIGSVWAHGAASGKKEGYAATH
ncbi:MAG TPA: rod shape-determining protein RodA [Candidatus Aphodovivens avistercoris]|nr:rod shape-determining protein RodA [Candidatus Aphodovivens avistercoris]